MKNIISFLGLSVLLIAQPSFAHPDGRVSIELDQTHLQAGANTLTFQLVDIQDHRLLTDADLNISHEKKLHFIVYDVALQEFKHEHPAYVQDHWQVDVQLPKNGTYFVWAQGEISSDGDEFSAHDKVMVMSGLPENPIPVFADLRQASDSGSIVTFPSQVIHAGQMQMLNIAFSRTDGTPVRLTPYLGAMAHVIATPTDGDSLVHVHPMDTSQPDVLMLHTTFPEVGFYRLWVQFIDAGTLKVVPLMVAVVQ